MSRRNQIIAVIAIFVVSLILLLGGTWLIWTTFSFSMGFDMGGPGPAMGRPGAADTRTYQTNGERIYFTGTSRTGPPITAQMGNMPQMPPGRMACASCHGPDGRGGTARMMMETFEAPDIRWHILTEGEHSEDGHEDEHDEHPPYTEESVRRAIIQGVNPAGEELDWFMPRWDMSEAQLDDLINYLQSME